MEPLQLVSLLAAEHSVALRYIAVGQLAEVAECLLVAFEFLLKTEACAYSVCHITLLLLKR